MRNRTKHPVILAMLWNMVFISSTLLPSTTALCNSLPSDDDILTFIPAILGNHVSVSMIPNLDSSKHGLMVIETDKGDQHSILVRRDSNNNPTKMLQMISSIRSKTGDQLVLITDYANNVPIKFQVPGYGTVNIHYTQKSSTDQENNDATPLLVLDSIDITVHDPSGVQKNLSWANIAKNIFPSQAIGCNVHENPQITSTTKSGSVTIRSSSNFDSQSTTISLNTTNDFNYGKIIPPPIATPYFDGTHHISKNNFSFDVSNYQDKAQWVSSCAQIDHPCLLGFVKVAMMTTDIVENLVETLILTVATSPLDPWAAGLVGVGAALAGGQFFLVASAVGALAANLLIEQKLHQIEKECEIMYDNMENKMTTINAYAYGGFVGEATSSPFNIYKSQNLPDLVITKNDCGNTSISGNDEGVTEYINMSGSSGKFTFSYETYYVEDRMQIYHGNSLLFDTGCVGTRGQKTTELTISPQESISNFIKVVVTPDCNGGSGTAWYFNTSCLNQENSKNKISSGFPQCEKSFYTAKDTENCIFSARSVTQQH